MSQRVSGYERRPFDEYITPAWVTQCLLSEIRLPQGVVWEPACGVENAIVEQLNAFGYQTFGSDIQFDGDFLTARLPRMARSIVTNPPFNLAVEFIDKACEFMQPVGGMVAMLLRVDFDSAKTRARLFRNNRNFAYKVVLLDRIKWFEGPKNPSFNHAWYVWDFSKEYEFPQIRYYSKDWV